MNTIQKDFLETSKVVLLALVLGLGINTLQAAWSAPTGTAPANNAAAPVHVGTQNQDKAGGLTLGGGLVVAGTAQINSGRLNMNTGGDHFGGGTGNAWVGTDGAFFVRNQADSQLGTLKVGTICLGGYTGTACQSSWPSGSGGTSYWAPDSAGRLALQGVSTGTIDVPSIRLGGVIKSGWPSVTTYIMSAVLASSATTDTTILCTSGDVATGGGYAQNSADRVRSSRPNAVGNGETPTGWTCMRGAATQATGFCYAVCQHQN